MSLRKTNCHPKNTMDQHMSDIASNTERQLTTDIVAAFARHNQVSADQLAGLISTVHQTLSDLGKPEQGVVERTPAVSIRRSVHRDYVICIECGWRGFMLRRHVSSAHGLTPIAYRARWGLSREHLLTAPAYSERVSPSRLASGIIAEVQLPRRNVVGRRHRKGVLGRAHREARLDPGRPHEKARLHRQQDAA